METPNNEFKSYGIFNKTTNNRSGIIKATNVKYNFDADICTFYFGHTVISEIDLTTHYIYEIKG